MTPPWRIHGALGLLSAAIVALQLVLIQILSITQWHHFAYMVISVALLGFGASGTLLALARPWFLRHSRALLPLLAAGCATAIAAQGWLGQGLLKGFDSYLLFFEGKQILRLLGVNLCFGLPFFLGATVIGLIFIEQTENIGSLYFSNLLGSGVGSLLALALPELLLPQHLPAVVSLAALASAWLLLPDKAPNISAALVSAAAVSAAALLFPPLPELSQYKDLSRTLSLPDAWVIARRNSPWGLVEAVSSPALRHAPGLSLNYVGPIPVADVLFSNGNAFGAVLPWQPSDREHLLDQSTKGLPFALARPQKVLVLHSGTGAEVALSLSHGAREIVAVEPRTAVMELLREHYARTLHYLFAHPAVRIVNREPRAFLSTDRHNYDLILLPTLGAFGGNLGLLSLQEQNDLTLEAFDAMWKRLNPEGLICIDAWMDFPARAPLRLAATLGSFLQRQGIGDPKTHLVAVRSWGDLSFCLKRSALTPEQMDRVRSFARQRLFDPALLPGLAAEERNHFNKMEDDSFFLLLNKAISLQRDELIAGYPFRLTPTTDDRPFFSQFLRLQGLPHLARLFGGQGIPFLEMGFLIAILSFVQLALAAVVLILLPLVKLGWQGGNRRRTLLYFGGLGLGYMLVEISLIHRFVLFLGHPVHAAATVICTLLVFSGLGSFFSGRMRLQHSAPSRAAATVAALLVLYNLWLPELLHLGIALALPAKLLLTLLLLAPVAFAMGLPFPLGLKLLGRLSEPAVPWAWGINGCLSVTGAALASILSVELGFTAVLWVAAAAYACAATARLR